MDQIRGKVNDELWILNFFEQWYTSQINLLCNWLSERLGHSLHFYQCTCLAHIVKVRKYCEVNELIKKIHRSTLPYRKYILTSNYKV